MSALMLRMCPTCGWLMPMQWIKSCRWEGFRCMTCGADLPATEADHARFKEVA